MACSMTDKLLNMCLVGTGVILIKIKPELHPAEKNAGEHIDMGCKTNFTSTQLKCNILIY